MVGLSACTFKQSENTTSTIFPKPTENVTSTSTITPILTETNTPVPTATPDFSIGINVPRVVARFCPSLICEITFGVNQGKEIEAIAHNGDINNPWFQVGYNGNSGWVEANDDLVFPEDLWEKLSIGEYVLPTLTPTISPLIIDLLKPGYVVEHSSTEENPYTFFTYFPKSATRKQNITIVVWPHGGNMNNDDYSYHKEQAENTINWLKTYSEIYQTPILVAAIPRVNHLDVHSLHPGTFTTTSEMLSRPDLKIIDAVWNQYIPEIRETGINVSEKIFMMGFSSPGMFTHRFAMFHPERLKAIWICGEAAAPIPAEIMSGTPLNYPLGTRNFEDLSGTPFDFDEYKSIPHFICVGENDTNPNNDTTTYTDIFSGAQGTFIRSNFGETNPDRIRYYYEFLVSVGVQAQFKLYRGTGHQITEGMKNEAFEFLVSWE